MSVEARSLMVPFYVFKPGARVRVWLLPTTEVDGEAPLAVLVDFDSFLRNGVGIEPVEALVDESGLIDRRGWASERFGVESKGRLVTYVDLSRYGWGLQARGSSKAKASYWTVMFAQTVMRQMAIRLIGCEMSIMHQDAQGKEVHFPPWVKKLKKEVKAYRNIKPAKAIAPWLKQEVATTWERIGKNLTQEVNRKNLAFALKRSNVIEMNRKKGDDDESAT